MSLQVLYILCHIYNKYENILLSIIEVTVRVRPWKVPNDTITGTGKLATIQPILVCCTFKFLAPDRRQAVQSIHLGVPYGRALSRRNITFNQHTTQKLTIITNDDTDLPHHRTKNRKSKFNLILFV